MQVEPRAELVRKVERGSVDKTSRIESTLVDRLRQKAETLGSGSVRVHQLHSGFARLLTGWLGPSTREGMVPTAARQ